MSTTMKRSRFLGLIAGTALALGLGGAGLYGAGFVPVQQESHYLASGPEYASVGELSRAASLVVRVRVAAAGAPYQVPFDPAMAVPDPTGATGGKGKEGPPPTPPAPAKGAAIPAPRGIIKTDFSVEVLEVLAGNSVQPGQRLTVAQIGGIDDRGRPVSIDDDPLLRIGEQEVIFLARDPASQRFFAVGGGQGRFKVEPDGRTRPVGAQGQMAAERGAQTLSAMREAVRASR
jgi:hypothetical protein